MDTHDDFLSRNARCILFRNNILSDVTPPLSGNDDYSFIKRAISSFNYWCGSNYISWEQSTYENHNNNRFYKRGGTQEKRTRAISGVFINFLKRECKGLSIPRHPARRFIKVTIQDKCISEIAIDNFYSDYGSYRKLAALVNSDEIKSYIYQRRVIPELDTVISKIK